MPNVKPSVFSPGCSLAGFPQDARVQECDIKRFKVLSFISLTFVGPTHIAKIGACIVIKS